MIKTIFVRFMKDLTSWWVFNFSPTRPWGSVTLETGASCNGCSMEAPLGVPTSRIKAVFGINAYG